MQRQRFELIENSDDPYRLPIVIRQRNGKLAKIPALILMMTLAAVIVLPQLGFAIYAMISPEVRSTLTGHPLTAIELALALAFWAALIVWPLRNILIALISDRFVDIRDGEVRVLDRTPFSNSLWQMPLQSFEGVALHTRTSICGVRQEAILVHPNRHRSIILMTADRIGQTELEKLSELLQLPSVPPARLYDFASKPLRRQNAVAA